MKNQSIGRAWNFKKEHNELAENDSGVYFEGKDIHIPVNANEKFTLYRTYENVKYEELTSHGKIHNSILTISGLKKGSYELQLFKSKREIIFSVI